MSDFSQSFSFTLPTRIIFGVDSLQQLADISLPGRKPFIICGSRTLQKNGTIARIKKLINADSAEVFSEITPNPTSVEVEKAARAFLKQGCDYIIGVGGGSGMDVAKAVAITAAGSGCLWDYVQVGTGKRMALPQNVPPTICIPTTAGTGSEANATAVITNPETQEKVGIRARYPTLSIVDPKLTVSVPSLYTAFQGFDALYHCIEAFISVKATPFTDSLCKEGIRLVFLNLANALQDGDDLASRSKMMWASTLGGLVIGISSCSTAHTIEHTISGKNPLIAHGAGLIMISDAFHQFFSGKEPALYAEMADVVCGHEVDGKNDEEKAREFTRALKKLKRDCGVDSLKLSDFGFVIDDIPALVKKTVEIAGGSLNRDRYSLSHEELALIYRNSLEL